MRLRGLLFRSLLGLMALLAAFGEAEAQLFSWGGSGGTSDSARSMRIPRSVGTYGGVPQSNAPHSFSAFGRWTGYSQRTYQSYSTDSSGDDSGEDWNGSYRTMCVRLCDGYYFPISYRTTRGRMYHDAKVCEASCDCETKLFYLPSSSSDIEHMTAIGGGSYGRLESAFEYRRSWNMGGCSCRPAPWTAAEQGRHGSYAAEDAEKQAELVARQAEIAAQKAEEDTARKERELAAVAEKELMAMRKREPTLEKVRTHVAATAIIVADNASQTPQFKTTVADTNSAGYLAPPALVPESVPIPAPAAEPVETRPESGPESGPETRPETEAAEPPARKAPSAARRSPGQSVRAAGASRSTSRPGRPTAARQPQPMKRGLFQM